MSELENALMLTTELVAAYVRGNSITADQIPALIKSVQHALSVPASGEPAEVPQKAAVSIKKSVTDDYIVCLECGRQMQSLKRHLTGHALTPERYRQKWGLPRDYPMVAPAYAKSRSELAKSLGLGKKKKTPVKTSSRNAVSRSRKAAAGDGRQLTR